MVRVRAEGEKGRRVEMGGEGIIFQKKNQELFEH